MTTYNTMNPVPSADARDRYDNSQVFDELMNGPAPSTPDRLGVLRQSWAGMQLAFSELLANSGFEIPAIPYAAGVVIDRPSQLISYLGELYSVNANQAFPYTLDGTFATDEPNLVLRSDQALRAELAAVPGAGLSGFSADETYPVGTVGDRLSKYITVTDAPFNAVADSKVTDNTAAILAAAIAAGPRGAIYVPPLVGYDYNALFDDPSFPVGVVMFDDSMINGGYLKDKLFGVYEKGDPTSEEDTTHVISSGHNAGIALDNTGKAGSPSALSRIAAIAWTAGRMAKGAIVGLIRSGARLEFAKVASDATRWAMIVRKRAPMEAITANYNRWTSGMTVVAGEFVFQSPRFYKAATSGVTGATPPTHTSGSVSDGGVTWDYFQFSYDATCFYVDDIGRICTNASPISGLFQRWRQSPDDTTAMTIQYEALGVSKPVTFRMRPTNSSGVAVTAIPDFRATEEGLEFISSLGSSVGLFTNQGFKHRARIEESFTAADSDTTPTVLNRSGLTLMNTTATPITNFDDGVTDQVITVITGNGNSTLVNGTGLKLQGGVNFAMTTPLTSITLKKTALSAGWIEISRCVK